MVPAYELAGLPLQLLSHGLLLTPWSSHCSTSLESTLEPAFRTGVSFPRPLTPSSSCSTPVQGRTRSDPLCR